MKLTLAALTSVHVACFNPQFQQGVPCAEGMLCPEGQICHIDNRCYDEDAVPDAGIDGAALAALETSEGQLVPAFDPGVAEYTLVLGIGSETLVVTPTAAPSSATIEVAGEVVESGMPALPIALNLGDNSIEIDVSSGNLESRYTIAVNRGDGILQDAYLKASNTGRDLFGSSVAVSGDTIAIGAPVEDSSAIGVGGSQVDDSASNAGAVYIFVRSGESWSQEAYIKASNTDAADQFGDAVALSGNTLVVGVPKEASLSTGINGDQSNDVFREASIHGAGAVYVFVREGTTWSQQAYIKASNTDNGDRFGESVAIDGDTLVVGANQEDSAMANAESNNDASQAGAVYVFVRDNGVWSQQAYLKASNIGAGDFFGGSVTVSGDSLVVGASSEDSNAIGVNGEESNNDLPGSGAVYVFTRVGLTWTQQAYLKASNPGEGDNFGTSVSLVGNTLAVAARREDSVAVGVGGNQQDNSAEDSGAVYVYRRSGNTWTQDGYIKASNTAAGDRFGSIVSLSSDGLGLAVSAPNEASSARGINGNESDNSAPDAGAVYFFVRGSSVWSQRAYIKASNTDPADTFGQIQGLSFSGRTLVVGARSEDSADTGVDGDQTDNSLSTAGAVYVFQ